MTISLYINPDIGNIYLPALIIFCICLIWPFSRHKNNDEQTQNESEIVDDSSETEIDYMDWGIRLGILGKSERAVEQFKRAIYLEPNNPAAHYNLALALGDLKQYKEAHEEYIRASELNSESTDIQINLGVTLLSLGKREDAIKCFETANRLDMSDPVPLFNMGCAYLAANDLNTSVFCFRKAVEIDPKDPCIRFNLAIALRRSGNADQAENELRDFMALASARYPEHRVFVQHLLSDEYRDKEE